MTELKELKQEADELGLSYPKNITAEKLQTQIDAFYEEGETAEAEMVEAIQKAEAAKEAAQKSAADANRNAVGVGNKDQKRIEREKKARELRVVRIIDNDQRVNNQTTTCTVNCSNEYFDLGTVILPLNEKIEVANGHIETLKQVLIPQHVRGRDGLAEVRMRPRYSISYEEV